MTQQTEEKPVVKRVLIVDDNKIYREALKRRLMLRQCEVLEAHDMEDALERIELDSPDVVITDLQMRTDTEGLALIKEVKKQYPLLPIIMISAVGTFEDGALAQRYGATSVLAKGRLEDDPEVLFKAIERAWQEKKRYEEWSEQLRRAAEVIDYRPEEQVREARDFVVKFLSEERVPPTLREEAYNLYVRANTDRLREESRSAAEQCGIFLTPEVVEDLDRLLAAALPCYRSLDGDVQDSLRMGEFLLREHLRRPQSIDLSRIIGFSYCYAVESDVKGRLQRRITRLLQRPETYGLIEEFLEGPQRRLSVHLRQHMLVHLRGHDWDVTPDNVRQTLLRILEHQERYKPDGLKALGIIVILFGREYEIVGTRTSKVSVNNPLGLKGLEDPQQVIRFAELLVQLQHHRNPYIHPEINQLEKVSVLRKKAFECLMIASQLT